MNFIPLGDHNPLKDPDGQARVLNAVLEQICLLRAEMLTVQGIAMMVGLQVGVDKADLGKTRIELRDDMFKKIHASIKAAILGEAGPGEPPSTPPST